MRAPIRVAIIDDEPLAREALRIVLATDPEVVVVGDCIGVDAPALIEFSVLNRKCGRIWSSSACSRASNSEVSSRAATRDRSRYLS